MKVIHFDSGLGNQMSIYAEYIAMKMANPNDVIYMEDISYYIPECNEVLCMWNGYELERLFGIKIRNISELFTSEEWAEILSEVRNSEFWKEDWNYPPTICEILKKHGIELVNTCKSNFIIDEKQFKRCLRIVLRRMRASKIGNMIIRTGMRIFEKQIITREASFRNMFISSNNDLYFGQTGNALFRGSGIEKIEKTLRETFVFPELKDEQNIDVAKQMKESNSVSIHARRGDLMYGVEYNYTNDYFKRSVNFIKRNVSSPHFYIFSDPESVGWVEHNINVLGITDKDWYKVINWNLGENSYIDMQLMAMCKHNIIVKSSYGFWGAYLNPNPHKIVCSPDIRINTNHHF